MKINQNPAVMSEPATFIPSRLSEARISQSITMRALASECSLSPTSISAYESGTRIPTPENLATIADKLSMPVGYFTSERPFPVQAKGAVFFRSQVSARTRKEQDKRKQLASWIYEVSAWISKFVALPKADIPYLNISDEALEEHEIEEIANQLRTHWGLTFGPISNMVTLLENKGIFVVRQPAGTKKLDAFSRIINGRPMIFLSAEKSSSVRSRFDAAHELGHLVLHQHLTQHEISERDTLKRIESEANAFASAFLMPEETFSRELHSLTLNSFQLLKKRWLVSIQAIIIRCEHIGAIDYDQKKSLMIQISSRGWRKREPLDDVLPLEEPTLAKKAWELIQGHSRINAPTIVDDLKLSKDFIASILDISTDSLTPLNEENKIVSLELYTRRNK